MDSKLEQGTQVLDALRRLVRIDHEAVAAFEDARERVHDPDLRDALERFRAEHEEHVTVLGALVRELGGEPPRRSSARRMWNKGGFVIADLVGDEAVLRHLRGISLLTNEAYAGALELELGDSLPLIRRFREHEREHLRWLDQRLRGA